MPLCRLKSDRGFPFSLPELSQGPPTPFTSIFSVTPLGQLAPNVMLWA